MRHWPISVHNSVPPDPKDSANACYGPPLRPQGKGRRKGRWKSRQQPEQGTHTAGLLEASKEKNRFLTYILKINKPGELLVH